MLKLFLLPLIILFVVFSTMITLSIELGHHLMGKPGQSKDGKREREPQRLPSHQRWEP